MLGLENIKNFISVNSAPYWSLVLVQGLDKVQAGSYSCENAKDSKLDDQIRLSCEALDIYLQNFKNVPSQIFAIELKKSATANGGSKYGWFQFQVDPNQQAKAQTQGFNGLGSISQSIDEKIDLVRKTMLLDFQEQELKRREQEFKDFVRDAKAELKDEKGKLQKKSAPIEYAFERVLNGVLPMFLGAGNSTPLAGVDAEDVSDDPRENIIRDIAQKLMDSEYTNEDLETIINKL